MGGMDYAAFEADEKTTFAVVRALEIIGEATKKIPPEVRQDRNQLMMDLLRRWLHDEEGAQRRGLPEDSAPGLVDYMIEVDRSGHLP